MKKHYILFSSFSGNNTFCILKSSFLILLRRRADSNRCIKVLQTSPLPLGYGAIFLIVKFYCNLKFTNISFSSSRPFPLFSVFLMNHAIVVDAVDIGKPPRSPTAATERISSIKSMPSSAFNAPSVNFSRKD